MGSGPSIGLRTFFMCIYFYFCLCTKLTLLPLPQHSQVIINFVSNPLAPEPNPTRSPLFFFVSENGIYYKAIKLERYQTAQYCKPSTILQWYDERFPVEENRKMFERCFVAEEIVLVKLSRIPLRLPHSKEFLDFRETVDLWGPLNQFFDDVWSSKYLPLFRIFDQLYQN